MLKKFIPLIIIFLCSCSPTFQIKPRQDISITQKNQNISKSVSNSKIEMQAKLLSEDEIVEIFDGNLLLASIIPIEITLTNKNEQSIIFSEKDFSLLGEQGRVFSNIKDKDVLEKLLDYYKIRAYNPYSYEKMKANLLTHSLSLKTPFMLNESRRGLVFFSLKKTRTIPKGLELKLSRKKFFAESLLLKLD